MIAALAFALARAWVSLYTHGLPGGPRDARRAEIACDLWEQRHEPRSQRRAQLGRALDVLGRVLRGVPADLAWRIEHRERGGAARRLRRAGTVARHHRWTVFPGLVAIVYVTGAAKLGTPGFVDAPEQLAMAGGAAAVLCGLIFLWRGTAIAGAAWLVSLGALLPTLLIARSAPLALVWAFLAMRAAVRRADALRAERERVAAS
jgi:hypothetical protein